MFNYKTCAIKCKNGFYSWEKRGKFIENHLTGCRSLSDLDSFGFTAPQFTYKRATTLPKIVERIL